MADNEGIHIVEEITRALDRKPFEPFYIVMASGERHQVSGRHSAAVGQSVIIIIPPPPATLTTHLRINQIVSVEVPSAAR